MWKVKLVQGVITQIIQTHGNGIDVTSINRQVYITGLQSEATIQVYDMLGKLVQVIQNVQNVQNNQALTINNSGVSILNFSTFTQQTQAKVFVE